MVLDLAERHGEPRERLANLTHVEPAWRYTTERNAIVFDVQSTNVQFSEPYAVCTMFPALKDGERYFRLEEVVP